jgi:hypothetical protein
MNLLQRIQDILLRPKATWPEIAAEPTDAASLYKNYLVILALIPAVAGFIGFSLVGFGGFGATMRIPVVSGLVSAVVGYVLSLVMVFVLALIVDALAPTFSGSKSQIAALKVVTFASTAGFVGGIFSLLPSLAILGALAGLYSIYLLYTGLPVLMKCPPEKAPVYTLVVAVCGIVAGLIVGMASSMFTPSRGLPMSKAGGSDASVSISTPGGEIRIDAAKMEEAARRMEAAGKKMEQAQAAGDPAAAGKAAAEAMAAITGQAGATPIDPQLLKARLPETLGGLQRESIEAQGGAAMGIGASQARATYRAGDQRIELGINDMGGFGGLVSAATWANLTLDRETDTQVEKVYKQGQRTVREDYAKDKSRAEYTLVLPNGLLVELHGQGVAIDALRAAAASLDLAGIEALKRPEKAKS